MAQMDPGTVITAGIAVVGAIVWLVRLEGRVNAQSQLHEQLVRDVTYIRGRIDAALNGHK